MIESKHSKTAKLPSIGDIKDGLLKMMLYTNLENVTIDGKSFVCSPMIKLTSGNIKGEITSVSTGDLKTKFWKINAFNKRQIDLMEELFAEANINDFVVSLGKI